MFREVSIEQNNYQNMNKQCYKSASVLFLLVCFGC